MVLNAKNVNEFKLIYENNRYGLELYEIDNSEYIFYEIYRMYVSKGQLALRNFITVNYSFTSNPWCDIANELNEKKYNYKFLKKSSIWFWEWHNALKINNVLAIQYGKPIAIWGIPFELRNLICIHSNKKLLFNNNFKLWSSFDNNTNYNGVPIKIDKIRVEYNVVDEKLYKFINKNFCK